MSGYTPKINSWRNNKGRIQIKSTTDPWGGICEGGVNANAASVICRELGFLDVDNQRKSSDITKATDKVFLSKIECDGSEETINECNFEYGECSDHAEIECKSKYNHDQ